MKNTQKIKRAKLLKNYYGHEGALYKGDVVILKEITSEKGKKTISSLLNRVKERFKE